MTKKQKNRFDIAAAWGDMKAVSRLLKGLQGYTFSGQFSGQPALVDPDGHRAYVCRREAVSVPGWSLNVEFDSLGTALRAKRTPAELDSLRQQLLLAGRKPKRSLYKQSEHTGVVRLRAVRRMQKLYHGQPL